MNHFEYRIYDDVYNDIISLKKNVEYRLLNDKSKSIKIGDEIRFSVLDNKDKSILVEVINKYIYKDIDDLWANGKISNNILNCSKEEFVDLFYKTFGKEKVDNSKIVGIEFKLK